MRFRGDFAKWVYTFVLLFLTVGWAGYVLRILQHTAADPNIARIVELSGASGLLGAMMTWNATIIYFWFRKQPAAGTPQAPPEGPGA